MVPIVFIATCVVLILIIWLYATREKIADYLAEQRVAGRRAQAHRAFAERYYPGDVAPIAERVREILEDFTIHEAVKALPSDCLARDLRIHRLHSLSAEEFFMTLEEEFGVSFGVEDLRRMNTLDDVIQFVARHGEQ